MVKSESWVLEQFRQCFRIDARYIEALSYCSSELLSDLLRNVYAEFKNNPHAQNCFSNFFAKVRCSERSLGEWLEQIVFTYEWLRARSQTAKFDDVVEYASCAWYGDVARGVKFYLDQFGFERSQSLASFTGTDFCKSL